MPESIGDRIKALRILSSMSQEELGRRVGVQRAAINKYEKGAVENIPIKTIEKIANALDVSPVVLVGWKDHVIPNNITWEVRVLHGVKHFFGSESVEALELFTKLNAKGKKRVIQYIEDISVTYQNDAGDDEHIYM